MDAQFKHVKGPAGTFESICTVCLLAIGVCSSEDGLVIREIEHNCQGSADEIGVRAVEVQDK